MRKERMTQYITLGDVTKTVLRCTFLHYCGREKGWVSLGYFPQGYSQVHFLVGHGSWTGIVYLSTASTSYSSWKRHASCFGGFRIVNRLVNFLTCRPTLSQKKERRRYFVYKTSYPTAKYRGTRVEISNIWVGASLKVEVYSSETSVLNNTTNTYFFGRRRIPVI